MSRENKIKDIEGHSKELFQSIESLLDELKYVENRDKSLPKFGELVTAGYSREVVFIARVEGVNICLAEGYDVRHFLNGTASLIVLFHVHRSKETQGESDERVRTGSGKW